MLYGNKAGELGDYGVLSTGVDDVILTLSFDNLNNSGTFICTSAILKSQIMLTSC